MGTLTKSAPHTVSPEQDDGGTKPPGGATLSRAERRRMMAQKRNRGANQGSRDTGDCLARPSGSCSHTANDADSVHIDTSAQQPEPSNSPSAHLEMTPSGVSHINSDVKSCGVKDSQNSSSRSSSSSSMKSSRRYSSSSSSSSSSS